MGSNRREKSNCKQLFISLSFHYHSIQAETMNFPLQNGGVQFQTTQEFVGKFKVITNDTLTSKSHFLLLAIEFIRERYCCHLTIK